MTTTIVAAGGKRSDSAQTSERSRSRAWSARRSSSTTSTSLALRRRWCSGRFLPEIRARNADAQRLSDLRPRLPRAPVGSFLFGHFGDRIGRKSTLVATMLTMGLATTLIGALPSYASAGVSRRFAGRVALCSGRWAWRRMGWRGPDRVENAPEGKRAWYGMFPQLGPPIGFLIATGLFLLLLLALWRGAFVDWAWRVPFLLSAVLVGIGVYCAPRSGDAGLQGPGQDRARQGSPRRRSFGITCGRWSRLAGHGRLLRAVLHLDRFSALGYGMGARDIPRSHFLAFSAARLSSWRSPRRSRPRWPTDSGDARFCSSPPSSRLPWVSPCRLCLARDSRRPRLPLDGTRHDGAPFAPLGRSCRSFFRPGPLHRCGERL